MASTGRNLKFPSTSMLLMVVYCIIIATNYCIIVDGQPRNCGDVVSSLSPCNMFLIGRSPSPSRLCCQGVRSLSNKATSRGVRQRICNCLKASFRLHNIYKLRPAQQLPGNCRVNINFPAGNINPNVDCSRV